MTTFDQELRRQAAALTHWSMSNSANRLARKAREYLNSGADAMPCELLDEHEEDMEDSRRLVQTLLAF